MHAHTHVYTHMCIQKDTFKLGFNMRKRRREAETDSHPVLSPRPLDFDFTVVSMTSTFPGFWKYVPTRALTLPCSPGEERSPVFLLKSWLVVVVSHANLDVHRTPLFT